MHLQDKSRGSKESSLFFAFHVLLWACEFPASVDLGLFFHGSSLRDGMILHLPSTSKGSYLKEAPDNTGSHYKDPISPE